MQVLDRASFLLVRNVFFFLLNIDIYVCICVLFFMERKHVRALLSYILIIKLHRIHE
jgi:hypothetical protein